MSVTAAITARSDRILQRVKQAEQSTTLYNPGTTVVYVDTQNPASTQSQPINPAAQLVWTAGDCYAVTAPGEVGSLLVIDNDGDINDPASIAANIKITGVPPIDVPNIIVNATTAAPGQTFGPLDTSAYQSIQMMAVAGSSSEVTLTWQDAGVTVYKESFITRDTAYYRTPCKGASLTVTASATGTDILAVESYRTVDLNDYTRDVAPVPATGTFVGGTRDGMCIWENVPVPHGGALNLTLEVPSTNGAAFVRVGNVGGGGSVDGAVCDSATNVALCAVSGLTSGNNGEDSIVLPCRPIHLRLSNTDGAVNTTGTIVLNYRT